MTQVNISFDNGKYSCNIDGTSFKTSKKDYIEYMFKKITGEKKTYDEIIGVAPARVNDKFGINERFSFVEKLVKMVASGTQASAVITGQGGLGKTYTVMKTLDQVGYKDISDLSSFEAGTAMNMSKCYTTVKGYSTAKGMYRTLFENNGGVIVFDDCGAVLKDPVALNILKGALDSYGRRIISWNADMRDEDLPRSFTFTGKVIFISNMNAENIDQAIRSRSMMIDLSMSSDQKIERMETLAGMEEFMPEFEMAHKLDAIALIKELKDTAKDISLRTLIQVTKIRSADDDSWKEMAEYVICA
jgi:Cdc6-like AAA superfamily ATPase